MISDRYVHQSHREQAQTRLTELYRHLKYMDREKARTFRDRCQRQCVFSLNFQVHPLTCLAWRRLGCVVDMRDMSRLVSDMERRADRIVRSPDQICKNTKLTVRISRSRAVPYFQPRGGVLPSWNLDFGRPDAQIVHILPATLRRCIPLRLCIYVWSLSICIYHLLTFHFPVPSSSRYPNVYSASNHTNPIHVFRSVDDIPSIPLYNGTPYPASVRGRRHSVYPQPSFPMCSPATPGYAPPNLHLPYAGSHSSPYPFNASSHVWSPPQSNLAYPPTDHSTYPSEHQWTRPHPSQGYDSRMNVHGGSMRYS